MSKDDIIKFLDALPFGTKAICSYGSAYRSGWHFAMKSFPEGADSNRVWEVHGHKPIPTVTAMSTRQIVEHGFVPESYANEIFADVPVGGKATKNIDLNGHEKVLEGHKIVDNPRTPWIARFANGEHRYLSNTEMFMNDFKPSK